MVVLAALAARAAAGTFDDGTVVSLDEAAVAGLEGAGVRLDDDLRDDAGHVLSVADLDDSQVSVFNAADVDPAATAHPAARTWAERELPLSAVIAVALRTAGLADDPVPGWRRRSRWSALIPAVSARVGNSQSWREVIDPTISRAMSYDVRASWRLDRLVFDPNEPRFAAFDISRRRERRRVIAIVSQLYAGWASAAAAATGDDEPARDVPATGDEHVAATRDNHVRDRGALIQAARARAELDAFTDGWFSDAVAKSSRSR